MNASDFHECDFIDCDACRTPYGGDAPHVFGLVSSPGTSAIETIIGVCDACDAKLDADRATAYLTFVAAHDGATPRRNRNRTYLGPR